MRVALLQIRLETKSPAANIQRLNEAIERAAGVDPAPDLLVLPGACDTGGATSGRRWHDASLECAKENIAWKAREWGVFVAAGLHVRRGDTLQACALLFDPDGDVVACSVAPARAESIMPAEPWPSAVGELAVLEVTIAGPVNGMGHHEGTTRDDSAADQLQPDGQAATCGGRELDGAA